MQQGRAVAAVERVRVKRVTVTSLRCETVIVLSLNDAVAVLKRGQIDPRMHHYIEVLVGVAKSERELFFEGSEVGLPPVLRLDVN